MTDTRELFSQNELTVLASSGVILSVWVTFDGVEIGTDSVICLEPDPWSWVVPTASTSGSVLNAVTCEALTTARDWLIKHFQPTSRAMDDVNDALAWADPNGTMPGHSPG